MDQGSLDWKFYSFFFHCVLTPSLNFFTFWSINKESALPDFRNAVNVCKDVDGWVNAAN